MLQGLSAKAQEQLLGEAWAEARRRHETNRNRVKVNSLISFTQHTYPSYGAEAFHNLLAATLDRVVSGEIKKLMVFAPPQHGKSELTSVRLPARWLGERPNDPVIITSYAASLAESKSRQARDLVESDEYRQIYPHVQTNPNSRAVDHWSLAGKYRGGVKAAGVGGPITGHGAMLGIIDDPHENWADVQSLTMRNHVWDWYRTTFRTRIWEGGSIVLVMTRWNEDDLAGRILADQGDQWVVLRLPAIAETQEDRDKNNAYIGQPIGQPDPLGRKPGEPLAPKRYSLEALNDFKRDVGSMAWAAEYQGVPRAAEGNRFKREWFPIVDSVPREAKRVRYWDKAASDTDGSAYTAGVLLAETPDGIIYVEHVIRERLTPLPREKVIKQTARLDHQKYKGKVVIWLEQEPGGGGKSDAEATIRNLRGFPVYKETVSGDKDTRLNPFHAQCEAGNVRLVKGDWNAGFIEEFCALPNGYRDQSDAAGGAFNKLRAKPRKNQPKTAKVKGLYGR